MYSSKISPDHYCDGVVQCLISQEDERYCETCPVDYQCLAHTMFCYKLQYPFPNRITTVVGLFIDTVYGTLDLKKYNMNLNILYISNVSITHPRIHETINFQTQLKLLTMINNNLKKLESFVFSNLCGLLYLVIQMNWIRHIDPHAIDIYILNIFCLLCYIQAHQTRPNSGGVADGHPRFDK